MSRVEATRITAADVLRPGSAWRDCEIWDGVPMVRDPSGGASDMVGLRVMGPLYTYAETHDLGWTFMSSQGFLIARDPDRLLAADGAFVSRSRLESVPKGSFIELTPDFLIEVRSPKDSWEAVIEKCGIWIAHGAACVWAIDPLTKTVAVLRPGRDPVVLRELGRVDAEPAVPGFTVELSRLFAGL